MVLVVLLLGVSHKSVGKTSETGKHYYYYKYKEIQRTRRLHVALRTQRSRNIHRQSIFCWECPHWRNDTAQTSDERNTNASSLTINPKWHRHSEFHDFNHRWRSGYIGRRHEDWGHLKKRKERVNEDDEPLLTTRNCTRSTTPSSTTTTSAGGTTTTTGTSRTTANRTNTTLMLVVLGIHSHLYEIEYRCNASTGFCDSLLHLFFDFKWDDKDYLSKFTTVTWRRSSQQPFSVCLISTPRTYSLHLIFYCWKTTAREVVGSNLLVVVVVLMVLHQRGVKPLFYTRDGVKQLFYTSVV